MDVVQDRTAAWAAVFRVIPAAWKVASSKYSSTTGLWSVSAGAPGAGAGTGPVTAWGRTEAEAARRLAELLEGRARAPRA